MSYLYLGLISAKTETLVRGRMPYGKAYSPPEMFLLYGLFVEE